jgi:hypothetical protein
METGASTKSCASLYARTRLPPSPHGAHAASTCHKSSIPVSDYLLIEHSYTCTSSSHGVELLSLAEASSLFPLTSPHRMERTAPIFWYTASPTTQRVCAARSSIRTVTMNGSTLSGMQGLTPIADVAQHGALLSVCWCIRVHSPHPPPTALYELPWQPNCQHPRGVNQVKPP